MKRLRVLRHLDLTLRVFIAACICVPSISLAQSGPTKLNISGGLFLPSGAPVTSSSVNFKIEVWDKNSTCVLYSEEHLGQDLSASKGGFSLQIGSGTSSANNIDGASPSALSSTVFKNSGAVAPFTGCATGVTLAAGDERMIRVYYDLGTGLTAMSPDVPVTSSAYAVVAETLQGKSAAEFVQVRDDATYDLNQTNVETIFSAVNFAKLVQILSGNFGGTTVTNVGAPSAGTDATNKNYVDANIGGKIADVTAVGPAAGNGHTLIWDQALNRWVTGVPSATDNTKLPLAGGTMTGAIAMGAQNITNTGHITMAAQRTLNLGTYTNAQETTLVAGLGAADEGKIWFNSEDNVFKVWNGSAAISTFAPSGAAGGDLTGTYPNPTLAAGVVATAELANDAVTSAKINNTGIAVNRLLITDATTGANVTYKTCALNETLRWTATGWDCVTAAGLIGNSGVTAATYGNATQVSQVAVDAQGRITSASNVSIAFPVVSVAGKTGAVTLNTADVSGLGTAAAKDYGTAAGNLVELDGAGRIPAGLLPTSAGDIQDVVAGSGLTGGGASGTVTLSVDTGTTAGKIVQLDASAHLPAVDGRNLSNINAVQLQTRNVAATAPTAAQVLTWNASASAWEPQTLPAGNVGDMTSVSAGLGLTGGAASGDATLSVDVGTTANKIVQLDASAHLPAVDGRNLTNINAVQLQTRNVSSTAPTASQVLAWNASNSSWEPKTETDAFSGTVTSVVGGTGLLGGNITATGTLSIDVGTTAGKIVQLDASAHLPAVDGRNLSNINAVQLQTRNVAATAPTAAQVLTWNASASAWEPQTLPAGNVGDVTSVSAGLGLTGGATSGDATLSVDVGTTANKIVQLDSSARLPAVDGSNLTGLTAAQISGAFADGGNTFSADATLGTNSNHALNFEANSATAMTILPNGNVGIANTNPNFKLTVGGNVSATDYSASWGNATNASYTIGGQSGIFQPATHTLGVTTSGVERMRIDANGYVGIGTSPVDMLTVSRPAAVNDSTRIAISSSGTLGNQQAALNLVTLENGSIMGASAGNKGWQVFGRGNAFSTAAQQNDFGIAYWSGGGWSTPLIIDSATGNMSLGTTNAPSRLTVEGSMALDQLGADPAGLAGYGTLFVRGDGKLYYRDGVGTIKDLSATGTGSVTSVVSGTGLTGGNITGAGTLAVDVGTTANKVVQLDASARIPAVNGSLLTNVNAVQLQARNVASTAPTASQVLAWNAGNSTWEPKTQSDAFTGTVTSVVSGSGLTGGNITSTGTLAVDTGTTANKIVQLDASARLPALNGSLLTNVNAVQLQTRNVSATAPTASQVLAWNATNSTWEPTTVASGGANGWTDSGASVALATIGDNVGIGVASPGFKLDVSSSAAGAATAGFATTAANGYAGLYLQTPTAAGGVSLGAASAGNPSQLRLDTNNSLPITFAPDGSERMRVNTTGLGIGTTTPQNPLHIHGSGSPGLRVTNTNSGATSTDGLFMGVNTAGDTSAIYSQELKLTLGTNGVSNRVTLDENGNFGIGPASPSAQLHTYRATTTSQVLIETGGGASNAAFLVMKDADATTGAQAFGIKSQDDYFSLNVLNDAATTSVTRVLTADSTGRIGIGVTVPSAVLHLKAGTAAANTAPLKFTSGTNLTTPENGAMEYDGTDLYITSGGTRRKLAQASTSNDLTGVNSITGSGALTIATGGTNNALTLTSTGTTGAVNVNAGTSSGSVNLNPGTTGSVNVNSTVASTSTTTGALVVDGGIGVAGAGYFGGTLDVSGNLLLSGNAASSRLITRGSVEDGLLGLFGGAGAGTGANIELYGGTHASAAGNAYIDANSFYVRSQNGATNKLVVDSAGRVGIGTSAPQDTLTVASGGTPILNIATTGDTTTDQAVLHMTTVNDGAMLGTATNLGWQLATRGNTFSVAAQQNDFVMSYWNGSAYNGYFTIDSLTGNVGLGTTSPSHPLHVEIDTLGVMALTDSNAAGSRISMGEGGSGAGTFFPLFYGHPVSATLGTGVYSDITPAEDTGTVPAMIFSSRRDTPAVLTTRPAFQFRNHTTALMTIDASGNMGIGQTTPTSVLHLKAGTATAGTAPLKLTAGTNLTTPENGAVEFDGTDLFITTAGSRKKLQQASSTGVVTIPLGTAAAPSLSFSGDPDTGIYSPGANQFAITTGGTMAASFDASGNINLAGNLGVGAASPTAGIGVNSSLTIGGDAARYGINNLLTLDATQNLTASRTSYGALNDATSNMTDTNVGANSLNLWGAFNRARGATTAGTAGAATGIGGSYNHGLNQSSSTTTVANVYGSYSYALNTSATAPVTALYGTYGTASQNNAAATTTSAYGVRSLVTNTAGTMTNAYVFYGSASGTIGTKWGAYITGEDYNYFSGNVGVGTTTPGAKLQVNGGTSGAIIGTTNFNAGAMTGSGLSIAPAAATGNVDVHVQAVQAGGLTPGDILLNASGGNVGIGLANPGYALSVAGTIQSTTGGVRFPDGSTQTKAADSIAPYTVTVITASGTFTPAANTRAIEFEAVGGGGGSGAVDGQGVGTCAISGGGSGGGYARKITNSVAASYTITIGAGGAAGVAPTGDGGAGGTTTVVGGVVNISAGGGLGGAGRLGTNGNFRVGNVAGGTATGGDVNISGGKNGQRIQIGGVCYGASVGGDSQLGVGGTADINSGTAQQGGAGTGYGSGGGGGTSEDTGTNAAGRAGQPGVVIVREYRPL